MYPQPAGAIDEATIHIIIAQHETHIEEGACLVTLRDDGYRNGQAEHQAIILPLRITHEVLLTVANRINMCLQTPRIANCHTSFGTFDVTHEPMRARPGLGFVVDIRRRRPEGGPVMFPAELTANAPQFVRIFHAAIRQRQDLLPGSPINLRVCTWFLNHVDMHSCNFGREVDLPPQPHLWVTTILQYWPDLYKMEHPVSAFLVAPMPQTSQWEQGDQFHIIVHQEPREDCISVLTTVFDGTQGTNDPTGIHKAVVIPKHTMKQDVLEKLNLDEWCSEDQELRRCHVQYSALQIDDDVGFIGNNGFSLKVTVLHADATLWPEPIDSETDDHSLLQILQPHDWAQDQDEVVKIDMKMAIRAFEWIDTHFLLPCYVFPPELEWHPCSHSWMELQIWEPVFGCEEIAIYHDGTSNGTRQGGGGVALFVRSGLQWYNAGHWAFALPDMNSYEAELVAALVATKALHDTIKIVLLHQTFLPYAWFAYDSITVGKQAASEWRCLKEPKIGLAIRAIRDMLRYQFGLIPDNFHVRGHTGEPGNEIVDVLADAGAKGRHVFPTGDILFLARDAILQSGLEWIWILFDRDYSSLWSSHFLVFPRRPLTRPTPDVFPDLPECADVNPSGTLSIKLCSCNVLSLRDHPSSTAAGLGGASRMDSILTQMNEQGIHIFALQETRIKTTRQGVMNNYLLIKGPATSQGHGGMMVGLATQHPHGFCQRNGRQIPITFTKEHVAVIHTDARQIIVRIDSPALRCIILAGHAPHTGADYAIIEDWWKDFHKKVPERYAVWPRLLLCDANARVGSRLNQGIGEHQSEKESEKAIPFEDFIVLNDIFLPSTFSQFHEGEGGTWKHMNGNYTRNDFIGIPLGWQYESIRSSVTFDIDPSIEHEDHRAVVVHCVTRANGSRTAKSSRTSKPRDEDFAEIGWNQLEDECPWHLDVHSHAHHLQQQLLQQAPRRIRTACPRKKCMTPSTWDLVCQKRTARKLLHEAQQQQKTAILQALFSSWKSQASPRNDEIATWDQLLCQQDKCIAQCLSTFRELGRCVTKAMRQDDRNFFNDLSQRAAQFLHPQDVKKFWQTMRANIPKFRQRKFMPDPLSIEELENQWHPYLEQLEAGQQIDVAQLVQQCHDFQMRNGGALSHCDLKDLTSLYALEDTLRETQSGKSTGLDGIPSGAFHTHAHELARYYFNLVLKMQLWQAEPIQSKGGILALIPKTGGTQPQNFRGIMQLSTLGKRFHALLRRQLIPLLREIKPQGQIGGFPNQQVTFGAQAVGTFTRIVSHAGLSSAVLYVDLCNAFHKLVRELVLGVSQDATFHAVTQMLTDEGFDAAGVRTWGRLPGLLQRLKAPPLLVKLLTDVHQNTWFVLANSSRVTWTRKGTRPGSPLADVIFHTLMLDITVELDAWVDQQRGFRDICDELNIQISSIVWSDDLAICWAARTAEQLKTEVLELLTHVQKVFSRRGFALNMAKGKTMIVPTFRGPGAPTLRKEFVLIPTPGCQFQFQDGTVQWVHFATKYKHLGVFQSADGGFEPELRYRCGVAHSTFIALSKPILCNRHLPVKTRINLYRMMVLTKLFYGMGIWPTPTLRQMDRLFQFVGRHLKRILACGKTMEACRIPDHQAFDDAGLPHPRVQLAVDRLLYAQKLFTVGPEFVRRLAQCEYDATPDSWLHGVFADIEWLRELLPDDIPISWATDLTDLFEFWETSGQTWRNWVKRALRKHLHQERMMHEVHRLHRDIFKLIEDQGGEFTPHPSLTDTRCDQGHQCFCGRHFTTAQGLALHRRKAHDIHAPEYRLVDGATCPCCLKFFWTSQRLYQHLAYISRKTLRNPCFQQLMKNGYSIAFESQRLPNHVHGLGRVDALQTSGPQPELVNQADIRKARAQAELTACLEDYQVLQQTECPIDVEAHCTTQTWTWFQEFVAQGQTQDGLLSLEDRWFGELADLVSEIHEAVGLAFLRWGQNVLPDIIAKFEDGEAEFIVDDAFASAVHDLPAFHLQQRIAQQRAIIRRVDATGIDDVPHRAVKTGTANTKERNATRQRVPSLFEEQITWQAHLCQVKWYTLPPDQRMPFYKRVRDKPVFLIAHLFSGRRRDSDFHAQLATWAATQGVEVTILSLDTAVSVHYGNLQQKSISWQRLSQLYRSGQIAATLAGPPCETWSAARNNPLDPAQPDKGPRPLRSCSRPWGLEGLKHAELRQCQQGSEFAIQTMFAIACHLIFGGSFVGEHPDEPTDLTFASIWRTGLMRLFRGHPDCQLFHVQQWRWQCEVSKPTGLLGVRTPHLMASMYRCQDPEAIKPKHMAIGRDAQGAFQTSKFKEYPVLFGKALAIGIGEQILTNIRSRAICPASPMVPELLEWVEEAAAFSSVNRACNRFLPDYQGV